VSLGSRPRMLSSFCIKIDVRGLVLKDALLFLTGNYEENHFIETQDSSTSWTFGLIMLQ
jgi:hypothetical protein